MTSTRLPPVELQSLDEQPSFVHVRDVLVRVEANFVTVLSGRHRLKTALGLGREVPLRSAEGDSLTAYKADDGTLWARGSDGLRFRIR